MLSFHVLTRVRRIFSRLIFPRLVRHANATQSKKLCALSTRISNSLKRSVNGSYTPYFGGSRGRLIYGVLLDTQVSTCTAEVLALPALHS